MTTATPRIVYKICTAAAWAQALTTGHFTGSADDQRDGFIHLSKATQLVGTATRHFRGQRDLVLVALAADPLGAALKWEPSRGGALFPHLYGPLDVAATLGVQPLPLGADGVPVIPRDIV